MIPNRSRVPKPTMNLQVEYERQFVEKNRQGFDPHTCRAWVLLTKKYGPTIPHNNLLSLANVVSIHMKLPLLRESKRRKDMLIRWFDDNIDCVWPFIETKIRISDDSGKLIDYDTSVASE
jgi:hypothetical protein